MKAFVGFSTPKAFNPVSWLVRKITKSRCSHAWVVYRDELFDRDMVMEAHELGFRTITFEHFSAKNDVVLMVPVDVDVTPGLRILSTHLGEMYDYAGLFGMSFVLLGQRFKRLLKKWHKRIRNPWASAKLMFCSESVVIMLQSSNSRMVEDLIAEDTSPQALMEKIGQR